MPPLLLSCSFTRSARFLKALSQQQQQQQHRSGASLLLYSRNFYLPGRLPTSREFWAAPGPVSRSSKLARAARLVVILLRVVTPLTPRTDHSRNITHNKTTFIYSHNSSNAYKFIPLYQFIPQRIIFKNLIIRTETKFPLQWKSNSSLDVHISNLTILRLGPRVFFKYLNLNTSI